MSYTNRTNSRHFLLISMHVVGRVKTNFEKSFVDFGVFRQFFQVIVNILHNQIKSQSNQNKIQIANNSTTIKNYPIAIQTIIKYSFSVKKIKKITTDFNP